MRVRFPLPAHLAVKIRLKEPSQTRKSERKVRHRPVLYFDSRLPPFLAIAKAGLISVGPLVIQLER
jgi:hypothetical protein